MILCSLIILNPYPSQGAEPHHHLLYPRFYSWMTPSLDEGDPPPSYPSKGDGNPII